MANENQQCPINLNITIPNIVVHRHDNREIGMLIESADHVTHNYTVDQPSVSQATSSQDIQTNPQALFIKYKKHVTHTVEKPSVSQATSSLQDMQINPQGSRGAVTSRKPTIGDIFAPDSDIVCERLQQGKYSQAFGVSSKRVRLDPAVIESKVLVDHYRCCILVGETEEAIRTKEQLKHLLKEKFQTTPNEIKTFADTIKGEGRDMEAILFSEIADDFMKPSGSHRRVTSLKPALGDIFAPDSDTVGQLLQEQKEDEACGVSRTQIKLDPAIIGSKDLVNHYRCCVLVEEAEDAIRTKDQLKMLINEKFQTTPDEIKTFADTIMGEERDIEPILFYQIAAEFYGNQSLEGLAGIVGCAKGIGESIKAMLSRDKELKPIVRTHVISLMRDMREMIRRSDDVGEEERCLWEVRCLHYIELSEDLVGDLDGKESTCKEVIAIMESVFKEEAGKYHVYGASLNNLGVTYYDTFRPNDAYQYFRKALAACRKAKDINDDERAGYIATIKQSLENAKRQMK